MNIGIDISQTAFEGTGVARYTVALAMALLKETTDYRYTFLFNSLRKRPPEELIHAISLPHSLKSYPIPPTLASFLWNSLHTFPIENLIGDVDIFISSDWTQPPTRHAKKVTIVHDLVPYIFPETLTTETSLRLAQLRISPNIVATHHKRLEWVKKECDAIIADSWSTRKDLIELLGIESERIVVVYPSVRSKQPSASDRVVARTAYAPKRPFMLTVGTIQPRKNIPRLVQAFCTAELYEKMDLLIVGGQGWGESSIDIPPKARQTIRFLGYVPDRDLFALYSLAEKFVMPSLYEGFGYPVIEAMAMGCPVAASQTSSLGELAEGYGETFDPEDVDSITKALLKVPSTQTTAKAQAYAQTFTPKRFAHEVTTVLSQL
jgi:glycosyltransferase involved in cell wall biosynthesis